MILAPWFLSLEPCILNLESCNLELSIIIINYNVKFLLEQCLYSVQKAIIGLDAELIVVDNHSADESISYLGPLFPDVLFIQNTENLGFAKANNQALTFCKGGHVLFLNPDTLLPEDILHKCLAHIKLYPDAGALGVRMIDGMGNFLPESKRAFPTPMASFCKLTGLSALFPRSGFFNLYALGNLDEYENHTVDVLAGAFMLVKKEVMMQMKGFDEDYFLYGEDIDLSCRLQKGGFQNLYLGEASIIHFKGESSGNHSLNRVNYFYKAMLVFVDKHYRSGTAKSFSIFLRFAIALRAMISGLHKIVQPFLLPLIDTVLIWSSLQLVRLVWINNIRHGKDFGVPIIPYVLPLFSVLFVMAAAVTGLYDKVYKTAKTLVSLVFATISILALYSLLPEEIRFSRGVVLYGCLSGSVFVLLFRQFLLIRSDKFFGQESAASGPTLIVGNEKEYNEVLQLLEKALSDKKILGRISPKQNDGDAVCSFSGFAELTKEIAVKEIIFCAGEISLTEIIAETIALSDNGTRFLFHVNGSKSIVGSDTLAAGAKTITAFLDYRITYPYQQRMKRLVDIILSLLFLISFPLHLIFHKKGLHLLQNAWKVFMGKQTWIGYVSSSTALPPIKPAVIPHMKSRIGFAEPVLEKADKRYAKEYDWWQDLLTVFANYGRLG